MAIKKKYWLLYLSLICFCNANSQLSEQGIPWGYMHNLPENLKLITLAKYNNKKLLKEELKNSTNKAFLYAHLIEVDLNTDNSGIWTILPDGTKIWFLSLKSKNAYSLGVTFNEYYIPDGAKLFIYNTSKTHYRGAFTSKNNKAGKRLTVMPVKGDEIIIEYQEPFSSAFKGELSLGIVSHDYKDILNTTKLKDGKFGLSGDCNIDINCELGDDWQEVKHSVCRLHINQSVFCTGFLVNTTSPVIHPYLLTANHCVDGQNDAEDIIAVFNYESPYCNGGDGSVEYSLSGATLKATSTNLDFSLLELSEMPPDSFKPYYSGWNKSMLEPFNTTTIHHPAGDVKKIARDTDTAITGNALGSTYDLNSYWRIINWEYGVTEAGSSGAPLFDSGQFIVGILSGGQATCEDPSNDYYTKFALAWDQYSDSSEQLKYWLDPENTNVVKLSGLNPRKPKYSLDAEITKIVHPKEYYCGQNSFIPAIIIRNTGLDTIKSVQIVIKINNSQIDSLTWQGVLTTYQSDTVLFNKIFKDEGVYEFKAEISLVNNLNDNNSTNNSLISAFTIKNGIEARLELITDKFGSETTWKVKDSSGVIVYYGGPYHDNTVNYIYNDFCFDYSEYTYTIYDKIGDGICCEYGQGKYLIRKITDNSVILNGGVFSDSSMHVFSFIQPEYYADFYSNTQVPIVNSVVQFYDNSKNAETWEWYFEGGIPEYCQEKDPKVNYNTIGSFKVTLSINDSIDIKSVNNYIIVSDSPSVAAFIAEDSIICINSSVKFINLSQKADTYSWTFEGAEPSTSSLKEPLIHYHNSGKYAVSLQINDNEQLKVTKTEYITVRDKPSIRFSLSNMYAPVNSVTAEIIGGTKPFRFYWNIGGNSEIQTNLSEGLYSIAVADSAGCIVTSPIEIKKLISDLKSEIIIGDEYKIYPNPVHERLYIDFYEDKYQCIELFDNNGKLVYKDNITGNKFVLNTNQFSAGIYFLVLTAANEFNVGKIIIE